MFLQPRRVVKINRQFAVRCAQPPAGFSDGKASVAPFEAGCCCD